MTIKTKIKKLFFLTLIASSTLAVASPGVLWQSIQGGTLWDVGTDVIIVDDSIFITGYTRSFGGTTAVNTVAGKFTLDGRLLWLKAYGIAGDDIALSIAYDPDTDSVWTAGYAVTGTERLMLVTQVSTGGESIQQFMPTKGTAEKIIRTDDGFVLAGWCAEDIYTVHMKVVKIDRDGNVVWSATDYASDDAKIFDICETDSGFIACGRTDIEFVSVPTVLFIDHNGSIVDRVLLPSENDWQTEIYSVDRTEHGFVFGIGSWYYSEIKAIIVKTDTDLNELWVTELDDMRYGYDVKVLPDKSILVGSSDRTLRYGDVTIVQLDPNGAEIERYIMGGDFEDMINNIDILPNGLCVFAGRTYSWGSPADPDIYCGMMQFNVEPPEIPKNPQTHEKNSSGGRGGCFINMISL